MSDRADIECLRHVTHLQTRLVMEEVRLTNEAIGRGRLVEDFEDQDDPKAFHVSRGRQTAIILPFRRPAPD